MNDATARRVLAGIDGPRPLPDELRGRVASVLDVAGLVGADAPRPLPTDLRERLEATLTAVPMTVPRVMRRRLATSLARPPRLVTQLVASLVVVLLLAAMVTVVGRDSTTTDVAQPLPSPTPTPALPDPSTVGPADPGNVEASPASGAAGGPGPTRPAGAAAIPSAAAAGSPASRGDIAVTVAGSTGDIALGFRAYVKRLNDRGGVAGRRIVEHATAGGASVATVNLAPTPLRTAGSGALFETAFVGDSRLRGLTISLASPIDRQARLAVMNAFPQRAPGARAAIYTGTPEPWSNLVPTALEAALQERQVTTVRVAFDPSAPAFVPTDAAFLSLPSDAVAAWLRDSPGAPGRGAWGVGSAWLDSAAVRAGEQSLRVLSPYAPAGGTEEAALAAALPGRVLSGGAVHGWVTAKALATTLGRNGGREVTAADLDALAGWESGWSPPFEVRPTTRARTPEAVLLVESGRRFVPAGGFQRLPR